MPSEFGVRRDITNDCEAAPFTVFLNHLVYKIIKSPDTGRYWLDRNLGATKACSASAGDEACYGYYYQWGRSNDGHESLIDSTRATGTKSTTITVANNFFIVIFTGIIDWTSTDSNGTNRSDAWKDGGSNDICPVGFSVPTSVELAADTVSATTTKITNGATAFSSFLKLPLAGYRSREFSTRGGFGGLHHAGSLWSRTVSSLGGRGMYFYSSDADVVSLRRIRGSNIRCIMDK